MGRAAGGLHQTSLNRSLTSLQAKRVVAAERPLSTKPSGETRYRVADPHLRFWLRFVEPHLPEIERGRGDRVLDRFDESWGSWRGRAVEPVLREALARLPGTEGAVGGYWTRTNDPEIDIVVADREPVANRIVAAGSIKWLERKPFDARDLGVLHRDVARLPGASEETPLIVVSRSGCSVDGVTAVGPEELLEAWT